ncbi:MAG: tetratricopeptide repeat protein [Candidatus Poribacteria bacterium]|nr:tetratricopeptide repeat protein [Candidatus Poribacteria bacterium]
MRIFQSEEKFSNYYQIDSCLDSTGNGFVYKARNTRLGNEIALKVFHSDLFPKEIDYQKFEQKAQTLGRLNHPNIARFFHYGQFEELPFVAMELVPGQSLDEYLKARSPLPLQLTLRLINQICTALQYVYKFAQMPKLVKPDLEESEAEIDLGSQKLCPSNIMVIEPNQETSEPIIRLTDFCLVSEESGSVDSWDRYQNKLDGLDTIGQLLLDMLIDQGTRQQLLSDWPDLSALPNIELEISELEPTINNLIQSSISLGFEEQLTALADWQAKVTQIQESIICIEDANAQKQQGEYRMMVESLQKAIDLLPTNQPIQNLKKQAEIEEQIDLADQQTTMGNFEVAIESWEKVLELAPSKTETLFHRATSEIGRLELLAQIKPLQKQVQAQKELIRQMSTSQEEIDSERDNFDRDRLSQDQKIDRLQIDLSAADLEVKSTKQEWKEEIEELSQEHKQQLEKLELFVEEKEKLIEKISQQSEDLTGQVVDLEKIRVNLDKVVEEQETKLKQQEEDIDHLQVLSEEIKKEKFQFEAKNSELIEHRDSLQKNKDELEQKVIDQSEELSDQSLKLDELGKKSEEVKGALEVSEGKLESLKENQSELSKTVEKKDSQIELLEKRRSKEKEVFQKLEQSWQEQVNQTEQKNEQLLKNQIQAETENIGFQFEWIELKESVHDLEQQLIQNAAFLEIKEEQIKQFVAEKEFIDQQVEELEAGFRLQADTLLEKDNLNQDLIASTGKLEAQIEELQAHRSLSENELGQKQEQIEQLQALKLNFESDLLSLTDSRDSLQQQLNQKEQSLEELETNSLAAVESLENQVSILEEQVSVSNQQLQHFLDQVEENNSQSNLSDKHQEFEKTLAAQEEKLTSLKNENSMLTQQLQDSLNANNYSQAEVKTLKNRIDELETTVSEEVQEISVEREKNQKEIEFELQQRDGEIQALTREKLALSSTVEEQTRMLKNAATKFKQQQQAIEALKNDNKNQQKELIEQPLIPQRSTANEYVDLGIAYRKEEKYQEAILAYQEAIKIDPVHEWAYNNIGYAYYCDQKYEESVKAYKQAIQVRPDHGWAYNGLGRAYNKLGQYQQAIDAFLSSTQVSPDNAEAFYNLAKAYAISEEYDLVLSYLKQAINQDAAYAAAAANEPLFVDLANKTEFRQLIANAES